MPAKLTQRIILGSLVATAILGIIPARGAKATEPLPEVTIHVRNYAGVEPGTLAEAEKVATSIFHKAGLQTRWVDTGTGALNSTPASRNDLDLSHLQLSILSGAMAQRMNRSDGVMGVAPGAGRDRRLVYVFYAGVAAMSDALVARSHSTHLWPASRGLILGAVIAHELGHILLNLEVHSSVGIMRGDWCPLDFERAARGELLFTEGQAQTIRVELARRATIRQQIERAQDHGSDPGAVSPNR